MKRLSLVDDGAYPKSPPRAGAITDLVAPRAGARIETRAD